MANGHTRFVLSLSVLMLVISDHGFAKPLDSVAFQRAGLALVTATVEGQPAMFLLDTGAERSCLDAGFAARLQLRPTDAEVIRQPYGKGIGEKIRVKQLGIESFQLQDVDMLSIDLNSLTLGSGISIDGIVGSDVLRHFTVRINFSTGSVEFGTNATKPMSGVPVLLQSVEGHYFVPLIVQGTPVNLLLDTGTNASSVSSHAWSGITMHWHPRTMVDGVRSTAGSDSGKFVLIPKIEIGGVMSRDAALRVHPQTRDGSFADANFDGLVGTDILRKFIVTLDLANNRMYLTSNPKARADPYLFSTIGIQFVKDAEGSFTIMAVWNPSPAARAGLKVGDRIVAVNQIDAHQMSLDDLSRRIHGRPGTEVYLAIDSAGLLHSVTMATSCLLCPAYTVRGKPE
jgi:predicted aspartyl protease